ncbi:receptor-like protein 7 [Castanea sativa]|uniref:receptor-like protein 7 n=1 Tax=Castanea sativa TaxID=21020 RepID=UPI003F64CEE3
MESLLYLYGLVGFLLIQSLHDIILVADTFSSKQSLCNEDERSALLQFKESIVVNCASHDPYSFPKVASWKLDGVGGGDCCSWDGIECDKNSGHVIGLDLSSSSLYGSINTNSSLFTLVHLQYLNMAFNDFNNSNIPVGLANLSMLKHLNLSKSSFSGQIPSQISELSNLVSLDLSFNIDSSYQRMLKLKSPNFSSTLQNLTRIEKLHLCYVDMSSTVPSVLNNLSSLTSLHLDDCGLLGEFPPGIFLLPNLKFLSVQGNEYLTGHLPNFEWNSTLETIYLGETSFSGQLPTSIGNLKSLNELKIWSCNFSGPLLFSLGNITILSGSNFPRFGELNKLKYLIICNFNLNSQIPYLANLTQLGFLRLSSNQLTGPIPSWLMNLTQLFHLDLSFNKLHGPIPSSVIQLKNLEFLHLFQNDLSGTVKLDMFAKLKNLTKLHLSLNYITFLSKTSPNTTVQKFKHIGLASCNLSEFPDFLREQDELEFVDLAYNHIHGLVPKWMWNTSKENLGFVNFSHNFLTGFDQMHDVFPWPRLGILDLKSNLLQGPLPIPPPSTLIYLVSNNMLSGKVSSLICSLNSLYALDLSHNHLSGTLPPCLGNFSSFLSILNLRSNYFHGMIPQVCTKKSSLKMLDLSENQLEGWLPRSLANCAELEFLILGNNRLHDVFPYWLGKLPELKVLILRSNRFHGDMGSPATNFEFQKLRILDLSYNNFRGKLPLGYFKNWIAMKNVSEAHLTYMQAIATINLLGFALNENYDYSMTITNKGVKTVYAKILDFFTAVDLSCNKFDGGIPEVIGNLKVLHLLNLSNNFLTDRIPSSLGDLQQLESLDLSRNKLSGEIPQQLTKLIFLEVFNVSYNNLTGPIPQGKQFNTFQMSSFEGNFGLCGDQITRKCGDSKSLAPPSIFEDDHESESPFDFNWKAILLGVLKILNLTRISGIKRNSKPLGTFWHPISSSGGSLKINAPNLEEFLWYGYAVDYYCMGISLPCHNCSYAV